jgi:hypothetical protein
MGGREPTPAKRARARAALLAPSRRPGDPRVPDRGRAIRAWVLLGAGVLGILLVLWIGTKLLGGGGADGSAITPTGVTGATGTGAAPFADPPPQGSVSAVFPQGVAGTRLVLKVLALGDNPEICHAESVRIAGDVRTVYHHGCNSGEAIDRAFFLVRLTNVTDSRVPVTLEGFLVTGADGAEHEALAAPPLGMSTTRFYPLETVLGPGVSIKRWLTIDGSDGVHPERLRYADGPETLTERFPNAWV